MLNQGKGECPAVAEQPHIIHPATRVATAAINSISHPGHAITGNSRQDVVSDMIEQASSLVLARRWEIPRHTCLWGPGRFARHNFASTAS